MTENNEIQDFWGIKEDRDVDITVSITELIALSLIVQDWAVMYEFGYIPEVQGGDDGPVAQSILSLMQKVGEVGISLLEDNLTDEAKEEMDKLFPPNSSDSVNVQTSGDVFVPGL